MGQKYHKIASGHFSMGWRPKWSQVGFRAARLEHPKKKVGAKTVRDAFAHPRALPKHRNYPFWTDLGPLKKVEKNRFFDIFGQKSVPATIRDLTVPERRLFGKLFFVVTFAKRSEF